VSFGYSTATGSRFPCKLCCTTLGIEAPKTPQLLGLQKIIDAVMSWPAMICLVAAAGLCAFAGALLIGLGSVYLVEIEQKAEAAFLAQIAGELQEDRREKAEQSKKDFDFTDRIQQLHRDKGLSG